MARSDPPPRHWARVALRDSRLHHLRPDETSPARRRLRQPSERDTPHLQSGGKGTRRMRRESVDPCLLWLARRVCPRTSAAQLLFALAASRGFPADEKWREARARVT